MRAYILSIAQLHEAVALLQISLAGRSSISQAAHSCSSNCILKPRWLFCCLRSTLNLLAARTKKPPAFTFCCTATNDLFLSLARAGEHYPRFARPVEALNSAAPNSAVLIVADNYPAQTVSLSADDFAIADKKNLRLYLEYPASNTPGLDLGEPKTTEWERGVVASDDFGPNLPKLRILALHDCYFVPVKAEHPLLVVARVAGFDTAVYGIPVTAWPILCEIPERRLILATTRLSGFIQNRFAPADDLTEVWETYPRAARPATRGAQIEMVTLGFARVQPRRQAASPFRKESIRRLCKLDHQLPAARVVVAQSRHRKSARDRGGETAPLPRSAECRAATARSAFWRVMPPGIRADGSQLQRLPLRDDCNSEMAMVLSLDAALNHHRRSGAIASNLMDYIYFTSDIYKFERADPKSGAFGLLGWGAIAPAWHVANYGDDNANGMLSTMMAGACLKNDKWNREHWDGTDCAHLLANSCTRPANR